MSPLFLIFEYLNFKKKCLKYEKKICKFYAKFKLKKEYSSLAIFDLTSFVCRNTFFI